MNNFLVIPLSAGGAAFLTAVIAGIRSLSASRLESEAALIKRLNDAATQAQKDADKQRERAEKAEKDSEQRRIEQMQALDLAAFYKRKLIEAGIHSEDGEDPDERRQI